MKRLLFALVFVLLITTLCGCSNQENLVSKDFSSDKNWTVKVSLLWNYEKVTARVNAKYNGQKPLDYVVIEPNYKVSGWPEGYITPTSGKYTWKAGKPEGALPDIQETSTNSNAILSKRPPRIMNNKEAYKILEQVSIDIQWKETNGEILRTRIN